MSSRAIDPIEALVSVIVTVLLAAPFVTSCAVHRHWDYSGANNRKATGEAQTHVDALEEAGVDAKFVSCMGQDTDRDGYVACTIVVDGKDKTIDCAGEAMFWPNHDCKDFVAKVRVSR